MPKLIILITVAIVICIGIKYNNKARELNKLQKEYNKIKSLLDEKTNKLDDIKHKYNTLIQTHFILNNKYKEELNHRKNSDELLEEAREFFNEQKQEISELKRKNKNLDIENEELFKKALLLKKDNDFNKVYDAVLQGRNIFLTGGAGTGKSYILENLAKIIPDLSNNITSTTGISAVNINGVTIHSWIGIKDKVAFDYSKPYTKEKRRTEIMRIAQQIANKISKSEKYKLKFEMLKSCKILAIDEISMLSDDFFNLFDMILKNVRKNNKPFGGIQTILIGDFCQLPPVIKDNFDESNQHFVFNTELWNDMNLININLKTIHRQAEDKEFANILNKLRYGEDIEKAEKYLHSCTKDTNELASLLHIYPTNKQVDTRNSKFLNKIEAEEHVVISDDYIAKVEYLHNEKFLTRIRDAELEDIFYKNNFGMTHDKIEQDTKAKRKLTLKVGCRVMLIKNINVNCGFVNGSMGTIKNINDDSIIIDIDNKGECIVMHEMFETNYRPDENLVLVRKQYPLILAYAITIHKAQGLTFDKAAIEINERNMINCGQGYVALSRVRTKRGLFIIGEFPKNSIFANPDVVSFYKNNFS